MTGPKDDLLAELETRQAELDAALKEMGIDLDLEDFDEDAMLSAEPVLVRLVATHDGEALLEELKRALAEGADPDEGSRFGATPVTQCFESGKIEALRLLLRHGASTDDLGLASWGEAILRGGVPEIADPMERDQAGRTPFLFACRVGNLDAARTYLPMTAPAGRTATPDGEAPVWMAVRSGVPEMLDWTLAQGFDVNARSRFGGTALLDAVELGEVEATRRLLAAGADFTLGENVTASLAARDDGASRSLLSEAADLIVGMLPMPADMPDTINTPVSAAHTRDIVRLLVAHGADPSAFDGAVMPAALGTDRIAPVEVSVEAFNRHGTVRAGRSNPEAHLPAFWREQIKTMRSGYAAEIEIAGARDYDCPSVPVWSFDRFGRTATRLPDGRLVLIAGEHEDHYDADFCIYADVTVLDGRGGVEHFIYPADVFPPTDFHSATLLDDHILLIGSLGYAGWRQEGVTQVLRLNLNDWSIDPVRTTGTGPGWINRHKAQHVAGRIIVTGGRTEPGFVENTEAFELDLATQHWTRIKGRA